jgi:hypothetical protein
MEFNNYKINGWLSLILVIITLIFVSLYFDVRHSNEILESRVNTLSSDLQKIVVNDSITTAKIKEQSFKEDYYLKQLDRDTNLILWLIPVIITIVGFFSFFNVRNLIAGQAEDQRRYQEQQDIKYRMFEHKILQFRAKLGLDDYELLKKQAKDYYEKRLYSSYLETYFRALNQKTTFYILNKKEGNNITEFILETYVDDLEEILSKIKRLDSKIKLSTDVILNQDIKTIKEISNDKINDLISQIRKNVVVEYIC